MGRSTASGNLAAYRAMRDFEVTSESTGECALVRRGDRFVVQKHAARGLHLDVRLELDGVLLSWSVPKGPSLAPAERRLAVWTEDDPLDDADFEGVIPAGQHGGGAVVGWDRGRWIPESEPHAALRTGRLTFVLEGEKLHGRWHLIRTRGADQDGQLDIWLLFNSRDEAASDDHDIVAELPERVLSGETIEDIADAPAPPVAPPPTVRPAASQGEVLARVAQLPLGFALTSLDRVRSPEQGTTKGELIAYLAVIADWILPHVTHRPLTLVRCPEGRGKPCFFPTHTLAGALPAMCRRRARRTASTAAAASRGSSPGAEPAQFAAGSAGLSNSVGSIVGSISTFWSTSSVVRAPAPVPWLLRLCATWIPLTAL